MRSQLVQHKNGVFTPDTVDILRRLERKVAPLKPKLTIRGRSRLDMGWEHVRKDPGPTGLPPEWNAAPTGREVYIRLHFTEDEESPASRRERELAMLWAIAVPLGLVPYTRYPLPGPHDEVFHYFGEWETMMDQLLGAGRGEAGWPAFCCAGQLDVGTWEGPRATERLVQAHLHRIGYNVGPIDGVLGNKTQGGLKAAGLHSLPLKEVAARIERMDPKVPQLFEKTIQGRLELSDVDFSIHPYGQVRAVRTVQGADLHVSGPGRIVLDVRESPS